MHLVAGGDILGRKGGREEARWAGARMWSQLEAAFPLIPRGALQREVWYKAGPGLRQASQNQPGRPSVSWVQVVFVGGQSWGGITSREQRLP